MTNNHVTSALLGTYRTLEAEIGADEDQWCRDTKPKGEKSQEGRERNRCRASVGPQDDVQNEEDAKDDTETRVNNRP